MAVKRTTHFELLRSMLALLVNEWGAAEVQQALLEVQADEFRIGNTQRDNGKVVRHAKPSASEIAGKAELPPETKRLIVALAASFDLKEFLPSAGDIRHFFEMNNEPEPHVKQRAEAFRKVLKLLSKMPVDALERLVQDESHRGPSRLGPLSEAMRDVGERRSKRSLPGPAEQVGPDLVDAQALPGASNGPRQS